MKIWSVDTEGVAQSKSTMIMRTKNARFTFIRTFNLLAFSAYFAFTNMSFGEVAAICDEPEGYILDNSKIKVLDFDCEENDGLCGFVISAPLNSDDRKFKLFLFTKVDENGHTVMHLNLDSIVNRKNVETSFYGTKELIKNAEIHAVYEMKENCALHSVWKFDSKL